MKKILIFGAGKIGSLMALLLYHSKAYDVVVADIAFTGNDIQKISKSCPDLPLKTIDITHEEEVKTFFHDHQFDVIISCLPYFLTTQVANLAKVNHCHYFDLTEDTKTTEKIKELAKDEAKVFVPQCGLAPGLIGIIAHSMMQHFSDIDSVRMRVGALPENSNNALKYALTWSTDGLINEYDNLCNALENGEIVQNRPLEGLETIQIDGLFYEAFNTSGGLGSLPELYQGKVNRMNYKTIRYPGHCERMQFLMRDLKLAKSRNILKMILESAIPKTYQDIVLIYVSVTGQQEHEFVEENYVKKIYPHLIHGNNYSAIQVATTMGLLCVMDCILQNEERYQGFVQQELIPFEQIIKSEFWRDSE